MSQDTQIIKVDKVGLEVAKNSREFKKVTVQGGKMMSAWAQDFGGKPLEGYDLLVPGASLKVGVTVKTSDRGTFTDIVSVEPHYGEVPEVSKHGGEGEDKKRDSIERQVSLIQAVEHLKGDGASVNTVLDTAVQFYEYLKGKVASEISKDAPKSNGSKSDTPPASLSQEEWALKLQARREELGFSREAMFQILGYGSITEYLSTGKTYADAIAALNAQYEKANLS